MRHVIHTQVCLSIKATHLDTNDAAFFLQRPPQSHFPQEDLPTILILIDVGYIVSAQQILSRNGKMHSFEQWSPVPTLPCSRHIHFHMMSPDPTSVHPDTNTVIALTCRGPEEVVGQTPHQPAPQVSPLMNASSCSGKQVMMLQISKRMGSFGTKRNSFREVF